jgi:DNA (cytosine-5)-methyltransferase 1
MAEQISLFDGTQPFKIDKPIRLIELFAGIGAQAKALENLGVDFEHYRICEFDKYAVKSYNAIHGTNFETSDITKITANDLSIVDTDKYCYVMTYSFPCQDLSNAGNGKGMTKGRGTRSGLLWEVERLLTETKELPQVLLMENVPQVIGQKNMPDFAKWIAFLDGLGYKSKYALLNAKDYGIPQNRERCFMVSILGDYFYEFPAKMPLKKRLKDMLEERVDERYYLSDNAVKGVLSTSFKSGQLDNRVAHNVGITPLCARDYKDPKLVVEEEPKLIQVAQLTDKKYNEMTGRVYSGDGLCPTIRTMQGGCLEPKVSEPLALDEQNRCIRKSHPCGCIVTDGSSPKHNNRVIEPIPNDGFNQRIRADSQCVGTITQNVGADLKRNGQGIIEPKILERFYANREPRVYDEACPTLRSERTGLEVVEPMDKYDLSDTMKRYINSYNDKYKVSDGNLIVNREIAVTKTTREGCTRADSSDYISADMEDNKNIAGIDCVPYRIRKLTPKECWRLMGFTDADVDKAVAVGISNAQLYKQAGNSIVVQVLESIFKQMI